jgi:hypothetical protein
MSTRGPDHAQATPPDDRHNLARLATEYWRLLRIAERALAESPGRRQPARAAQLRYATQRLGAILADSGMRVIAYDGEKFEPNLPVTVINAEDAAGFADPVIERTIEPTITAAGEVLAIGKVALFDRS